MDLARRLLRIFCLTLCALLPTAGWAFDLNQLRAQLTAAPVVRGQFVQEKHLRALPQPLVSRGDFVLAIGQGMLWKLRSPLAQNLRMTANGIARQLPDGSWYTSPGGNQRESRLFLDLLGGNTDGLSTSFDLELSGTPTDWHMIMKPNSLILRQIFTHITVHGGALVQTIELRETQGDSTLLRMENAQTDGVVNEEERRALSD